MAASRRSHERCQIWLIEYFNVGQICQANRQICQQTIFFFIDTLTMFNIRRSHSCASEFIENEEKMCN
jgi:hypothetical protein